MANIKISALNTYTGNPSDNRWFIMNNSANTETFKYSGYSSPLRYGTPDNSIISPYLSPSSVGGIYDLNIQGTGNTITNTEGLNQIIGGSSNGISGDQKRQNIINSLNCTIVANSAVGGGGLLNGIYMSENSNINGSSYCVMLGARDSNISSDSRFAAQIASRNNTIIGAFQAGVFAGHNHTLNGVSESGIFGGYSQNITNAIDSGIYSGRGNIINGSGSFEGGNAIFGGRNNAINNSPGGGNAIMAGNGNTIITSAYYSTIINGLSNQISSSESRNVIIAGNNNTITGTTSGSTMIGTKTRTPIVNDTVHVENLRAYGQSYDGYFNNGSGSTFTIDWNNGNTQKMNLTGAGGITCNNTQTGASYRMIINNPGGFTPTSFTASGRAIKFNGGSFVTYTGESICELFITNDSVYVNQLGLFS